MWKLVESEYANSCEYVEHAKMCVNDILRRSMNYDGQVTVSRGVTEGLTTLESAVQSGASFKRFWCEMPKVRMVYRYTFLAGFVCIYFSMMMSVIITVTVGNRLS